MGDRGMKHKLNNAILEKEIKHIWESLFREPSFGLFGLQLKIGNNVQRIYESNLYLSLDDFSERILAPMIYQYIEEQIKPMIDIP